MTDASVAMTGGPGGTGRGGTHYGVSGQVVPGQVGSGQAGTAGTAEGSGAGAVGLATGPAREQPSALELAELWLEELADRVSVPASQVQDRLLDLWGSLDDGPQRVEVERWLTETLRRNLYSVSDISDRLESLLATS